MKGELISRAINIKVEQLSMDIAAAININVVAAKNA
jgi:hypothetical protein